MNYRIKYDEQTMDIEEFSNNKSGRKSKTNALNELQTMSLSDKDDVYRFQGYFEGSFEYWNHDRTRCIDITWECTAGVTILTYMTIQDLLDVDCKISHIEISLWE